MTPDQIQGEAERIVRLQLSFVAGYDLFRPEEPHPLDPQLVVMDEKGKHYNIFVRGLYSPSTYETRDLSWEADRREFAASEGFVPYFIQVEMTPQGKGQSVVMHGMEELQAVLRAGGSCG